MAEEQSTHVMYRGRHYVIPGKHGPEEAYRRVQNLAGPGPKLRTSEGPVLEGFEDTSKDAEAVLRRHADPNAPGVFLPRLAEFALLYGAIPGAAGLPAKGLAALRGLTLGQKAATAGKAATKAAAYGAAGYAANEGLQAVGVPRGVSELVVGAAGMGTKPGREAIKAGVRALAGAPAAEAAAVRAAAPAVEAAVAAPAVEAAAATRAATVNAQAAEIAASIAKWQKNGWSQAQMTSALRNVYGISPKDGKEFIRLLGSANAAAPVAEAAAVKAAASPLQAPRIEVGSQKVGRQVGMTKEEVRRAAGPVLDEALGEASPILPRQALKSIVDTMRAMPMAEREAYVARATSGKAKWQVENIRRTLEHLGLLIPASAAAAAAGREK